MVGPTLCPSPQVCNKYSIYFPQCLPPCENGSGEYTCTSSSTAATSTSSPKVTSTKTTLSTSTIVGTTSTPSYTTTPIVSTTTSSAITYVTPWGQCKIFQYNDQEYPLLTQTQVVAHYLLVNIFLNNHNIVVDQLCRLTRLSSPPGLQHIKRIFLAVPSAMCE